jgi:hypothetical protein
VLLLLQNDSEDPCPLTYASTSPIVNVSGAVTALLTGTYTLKRTHAREFSALGRIMPPTSATYDLPAGIYPATAKQTRDPDGNFNKPVIQIFTLVALQVSGQCEADQVLYKGTWYEVDKVNDWSESGGFFEAIAVSA